MVATLAGLMFRAWLLFTMLAGSAALVAALLAPLVRTRRDRRRPERVAARQQTRATRQLTSAWPLLSKTLRLGFIDPWTGEHRWPAARFAVDDQGVAATVAAIPGAGLVDYQQLTTALAMPGAALPCGRPSSAPGW